VHTTNMDRKEIKLLSGQDCKSCETLPNLCRVASLFQVSHVVFCSPGSDGAFQVGRGVEDVER